MNLYGDAQSTYGIPATIINYFIQEGRAVKWTSLIGWGDTSGEFMLFLNGNPMGGARSSAETRTIQVWWDAPIVANPGDLIEVVGCHFSPGLRSLKANLMGVYV